MIENIDEYYKKWLDEITNQNIKRKEIMDKCCLLYCKEVFEYAYKLGFDQKMANNWEELNQK